MAKITIMVTLTNIKSTIIELLIIIEGLCLLNIKNKAYTFI